MISSSLRLFAVLTAAAALPLSAQITFVASAPGANELAPVAGVITYTQDFNSLPTASGSWTDNSSLPGWYANRTAFTTTGGGGSSTGVLYNYGTSSGSSDRSLGSLPNTTSDNVIFGLRLVNNTGATITGFDVDFIVEQWRRDTSPNSQVTLSYQIFAADAGSVDAGSWTTVVTATPSVTGAGGSIVGNLVENQLAMAESISSIAWEDGQELWVRWAFAKTSGSNIHIAIEDFSLSVNAIPEPATAATLLGLLGLAAMVAHRRRR